jgi:hypothetical protein
MAMESKGKRAIASCGSGNPWMNPSLFCKGVASAALPAM